MPNLSALIGRVDHHAYGQQGAHQQNRQEPARRRLGPEQPQACECQRAHALDPGKGELCRLLVPLDDLFRNTCQTLNRLFRRRACEIDGN